MAGLKSNSQKLTSQRKPERRDYDPEDDPPIPSSSEDDSESEADEADKYVSGREHYEKVGKSRIRQLDAPKLDASKYGGVAVSRSALDAEDEDDEDPFQSQDDEDDDPFTPSGNYDNDLEDGVNELDKDGETLDSYMEIDEDEEIDSDEALGQSDEELSRKFVFRGSKKNQMTQNGHVEDEESGGSEEEQDEDGTDEEASTASKENSHDPRRAALAQSLTASLAQTLSASAAADATKGRAVRQQYKTFDRLLDARIRLQKSVVASEQLLWQTVSDESVTTALDRAEDAAIRLFNTIDALRQDIADARPSTSSTDSSRKRKRMPPIDMNAASTRVYDHLTSTENSFTPLRRQIIDKWNQKIKLSDPSRIADGGRSKFSDASAHNDRLTEILDTYITNETDKYFRTHEAESDAKDSVSQNYEHKQQESLQPPHYDLTFNDNMFYQSLLRDLISTRSTTLTTTTTVPILPSSHKLHASGNTAKQRQIDTKASKGRKVRYTVHEKLQNFMAAQGDVGRDTAMWTERGKDEFFGSLFGMSRALAEDDDGDDDEKVDGDRETEALRLFRS